MNTITEIENFQFSFNELGIKPEEVALLAGYETGVAPEPFSQYINDVFEFAATLKNICGAYTLFENVIVNKDDYTTSINNTVFYTGKTITMQLHEAKMAAIFVCTAGDELENYASEQMSKGNLPEGYIADIVGSVVVEKAKDKIKALLEDIMKMNGLGITNHYCPGYCDWNVCEQQKLFSLLPSGVCNITLSESMLMHPIKSISGIIGIKTNSQPNLNPCKLCNQKNCHFRNKRIF